MSKTRTAMVTTGMLGALLFPLAEPVLAHGNFYNGIHTRPTGTHRYGNYGDSGSHRLNTDVDSQYAFASYSVTWRRDINNSPDKTVASFNPINFNAPPYRSGYYNLAAGAYYFDVTTPAADRDYIGYVGSE